MEVEQVAVHDEGELADHLPLVMHMLNDGDFLSSQWRRGQPHDFGIRQAMVQPPANLGWNAESIRLSLARFELAFDSYLTLGATSADATASGDDWTNEFVGPTPASSTTPQVTCLVSVATARREWHRRTAELPQTTPTSRSPWPKSHRRDALRPIDRSDFRKRRSQQRNPHDVPLCSGNGNAALTDPDAINYVAYDPAEVFYDDDDASPGNAPPHATTTLKPTPTTAAASSKTPWACVVAPALPTKTRTASATTSTNASGHWTSAGSATALAQGTSAGLISTTSPFASPPPAGRTCSHQA